MGSMYKKAIQSRPRRPSSLDPLFIRNNISGRMDNALISCVEMLVWNNQTPLGRNTEKGPRA